LALGEELPRAAWLTATNTTNDAATAANRRIRNPATRAAAATLAVEVLVMDVLFSSRRGGVGVSRKALGWRYRDP